MEEEAFVPSAISGLDRFFEDFPLPFLSRDPSKQRLEKCPETLSALRDGFLTRDWTPTTPEEELGLACVSEIYLIATGNFEGPAILHESPHDEIESLKQSHRLARSSFGFIKEGEPDHVKLTLDEVPDASAHRLLQFCVARGVQVGHDTERDELCEMARWIISNENDGVSFKNMLAMMQQAIDLSVLAQQTGRLEGSTGGDAVIERLVRKGVDLSARMRQEIGAARREGADLVVTAQDAAKSKATAEFQAKVLQTLASAQARAGEATVSEEPPM